MAVTQNHFLHASPQLRLLSGTGFAGSVYEASRPDVVWLADGVVIEGAEGARFTRGVLHEEARLSVRANGLTSAEVPPAYVLPDPILLEGFETLTGVTAMGGSTLSLHHDTPLQGGAGLAMAGSPTASGNIGMERSLPASDPAGLGTLAYASRRHSEGSVGTGWWYMYRDGATGFVPLPSMAAFPQGWRWTAAHVSEFPALGGVTGTGGLKVRLMHQNISPFGGSFLLDGFYARANGRPSVLFTFDDQWDTHRTVALPILAAAGFKGTAYVSPGLLGSGGIKSDTAQLQKLYAAGWDLACDSWRDDSLVTGHTTASAVAEVVSIRDWLVENGMARAARHGTWPYGQFSEALIDGLLAEGFLTFRSGGMAPGFLSRFGLPRATRSNLPCRQLNQTSGNLAQALIDLERAVLRGETLIFSCHDLRPTPSSVGWTPEDFATLVAAVKARADLGQLSVLTQSELWQRDGAKGLP